MKWFLGFLVFLFLSACATSQSRNVPEIDHFKLPIIHLKSLKPRTLFLSVENNRAINRSVGNSAQVEGVVYANVLETLKDAGLSIGPSENQLKISIEDCTESDITGECVRLVAKLEIPGKKLQVRSMSSNGYSKEKTRYGNISEAYTGALQVLLKSLDDKLAEL